MKAGNITRLPLYLPFILGVCLLGTIGRLPLRGAQVVTKPAEEAPATPAAPDAEQSALDDAFRSAQGNPQLLIKNFEAFLVRFPQSSRREAVLRTICTYAQEANAPDVVVQYGQMLLERTPNDPHLLTLLMDALARQNDQASRTRAIEYSSRLIAIAESQRDQAVAAAGSSNAADQWAERLAGIYARRAGFYRDSDEVDKAVADCEKSYAIYPTSRVAEQLGDAALKKGNSARALDYYLTAFVFPDKSPEPGSRQEIRRKLGSLYVAQHHSEHGLGDLVLSHYDAIMPQLWHDGIVVRQHKVSQTVFGMVLRHIQTAELAANLLATSGLGALVRKNKCGEVIIQGACGIPFFQRGISQLLGDA